MKRTILSCILLLLVNLLIGGRPLGAATINEYLGLWQGQGTYVSSANTEHFTMSMNLSRNGDLLVGLLRVIGNQNPISIQGPLVNGVFTFLYPNDDPGDPDCVNWDVTGRAFLDAAGTTMTMILSGTFCGTGSGAQGKFTGTLRKIAVNAPMMLLLDMEHP